MLFLPWKRSSRSRYKFKGDTLPYNMVSYIWRKKGTVWLNYRIVHVFNNFHHRRPFFLPFGFLAYSFIYKTMLKKSYYNSRKRLEKADKRTIFKEAYNCFTCLSHNTLHWCVPLHQTALYCISNSLCYSGMLEFHSLCLICILLVTLLAVDIVIFIETQFICLSLSDSHHYGF